jgi:hypothetical protein
MDVSGGRSGKAIRVLSSDRDFDEYWKFHELCEYKRNYQDLYENHKQDILTCSPANTAIMQWCVSPLQLKCIRFRYVNIDISIRRW